MKTIILACQTIKDEVEAARERTGCLHEIVWVESGLHNVPDKLRARLQEELDGLCDADRVLMAFGFCGNSMLGITAGNKELVFPKVDDCITLVLGSFAARRAILDKSPTYFLTQGWLTHESNIWKEYEYSLEKYGEENTAIIYDMLLANYRSLGVIDTGCYDYEEFCKRAAVIADTLKLKLERHNGTISYISELLTGPWNEERYITIPPGGVVTMEMLVC
ncbi:MAG: DUF1638 domain-containing protein [Oscillospiraceae bacterium]|nr:DUF1638 domain-containing protein [Oscillospiraceae bacterium]